MADRATTRTRPGFIFLPTDRYNISYKVLVTDESTGTETDVTNWMKSVNISCPLGRLAGAKVTLSNADGKWLNKWNGGEKIEIWVDYVSGTPTNKLFRGKIDNVYYSFAGGVSGGYSVNFDCRQTPEVTDIKIVKEYINALVSDAIKDIIDTYYSGVLTYTNVTTTTTRVTTTYRHTSGIKAFEDLAKRADMDLYIDTSNDVHLFTKESVTNNDEYINDENNLKSVSRYGKDNTKIFNRVVCYGKEDNNIILLKTEDDADSQSDLWRKDLIITDNKLTSMDEIQDRANVELTNNTNIEEDGRISSLGLPKLRPGDMIPIDIPYCGINGFKRIRSVDFNINESGFLSTVQIADKQDTLSEIFRDRIDAEDLFKPYSNINDMSNSYTVYFDEDPSVVSLTNCEIDNENRLKISAEQSEGECISNIITTDNPVTICELRLSVNFPNHELSSFYVTNNGGSSWESLTPGTLHTMSSTGSNLAFKINLVEDASHDPYVEAITILYK